MLSKRAIDPWALDVKACRKSMQKRLMALTPANDHGAAERVARDVLLNRCHGCGQCWMARL